MASEWPGGVAVDVLDGLLDGVDHAHGEDQVEVLRGPVVLVGRRDLEARRGGAGALAAAQLHAAVGQRAEQVGEQIAPVGVHQQRLHRVAHARAVRLGVDRDRRRHGRVGASVDVDVAHAAGGDQHRDARVLQQEVLQRLAAAGHHDVRVLGERDEGPELVAAAVEVQHRVLGQPGRLQPGAHGGAEGGVRAPRGGRAAQDRDVARLQAQAGDVDRHVGARLVDDQDAAERHADARELQAVRPPAAVDHLADGIGQGGDVARRRGQRLQARCVERQAVDERRRRAIARRPPRRPRRSRRGSPRGRPAGRRRWRAAPRPWRRCRARAARAPRRGRGRRGRRTCAWPWG